MRFIKKLVILTGSGARGTLMLEKNSFGAWGKLSVFDLAPGEYRLIVISGDTLLVKRLSSDLTADFSLGEIDFEEVHVAIVTDRVVMYGSNCATKLSEDVIMSRVNSRKKIGDEFVTYSGREKSAGEFFKRISPSPYDDFAIAEKNFYPAYLDVNQTEETEVHIYKQDELSDDAYEADTNGKLFIDNQEIPLGGAAKSERAQKVQPHTLERQYLEMLEVAAAMTYSRSDARNFDREYNNERDNERDIERNRENDRVRDRDLEREREYGSERGTDRNRVSGREQESERDRGRVSERESERGTERENVWGNLRETDSVRAPETARDTVRIIEDESANARETVRISENETARDTVRVSSNARDRENLRPSQNNRDNVKGEEIVRTEPRTRTNKETELRDYKSGETKQAGRKATFFERSMAQIDKLLSSNERCEVIEKLIPGSRFVKIRYDQGRFYVVGTIGRDYICYGVPAPYTEVPPEPLKGYARWLPLSAESPRGDGFWIMYQDGISGETIRN